MRKKWTAGTSIEKGRGQETEDGKRTEWLDIRVDALAELPGASFSLQNPIYPGPHRGRQNTRISMPTFPASDVKVEEESFRIRAWLTQSMRPC